MSAAIPIPGVADRQLQHVAFKRGIPRDKPAASVNLMALPMRLMRICWKARWSALISPTERVTRLVSRTPFFARLVRQHGLAGAIASANGTVREKLVTARFDLADIEHRVDDRGRCVPD